MIEVRLEGVYQDYEDWVCAGSVDHFMGRNCDMFAILGNVGHYQDYEKLVCAGSVDHLFEGFHGAKPISCGRLTRKVVLTKERIAEEKKRYEEDDEYSTYPSFDLLLKDTYMYALQSDYCLTWAFTDWLVAQWEDGKCHDPNYVSYGCHDQSFVTLKEMMDYNLLDAGYFECKDSWFHLIDFLRRTGELYEQTNPERIRLCFFFDS
jgi:hypothetical protein